MTALLEQVFREAEQMPEEAQDAIAARWLAELEDEKDWTESFEKTTDDQWERMAAMVRRDIAAGKTTAADHSFSDANPRK